MGYAAPAIQSRMALRPVEAPSRLGVWGDGASPQTYSYQTSARDVSATAMRVAALLAG
jgi:hypothetical protein